MRALQSNLRNAVLKKDCFLYKNLSLPLTFPMTLLHMDNPDSELSKIHPKYSTTLYCLIFISPLLMSNTSMFLRFLLVPKTIDLVLSSPKWILKLIFHKPIAKWVKFFIQFLFYFFDIFPSKNEARIICIKKKVTIHRLSHVINIHQENQRTKNWSLWYPAC